ncbi:MAG TPA: hypothetical protein ENK09_09380 [Nitrospirae bacterium]|nr:hypothetical protein [Nitrospirota bacterium]
MDSEIRTIVSGKNSPDTIYRARGIDFERIDLPRGRDRGESNARYYFHHIRSLYPVAETTGNTLAVHLNFAIVAAVRAARQNYLGGRQEVCRE